MKENRKYKFHGTSKATEGSAGMGFIGGVVYFEGHPVLGFLLPNLVGLDGFGCCLLDF